MLEGIEKDVSVEQVADLVLKYSKTRHCAARANQMSSEWLH